MSLIDSRRLYCDEIAQVTWRRRLEELICGGTSYSMRSRTLSQCRDLRIWSGMEDLIVRHLQYYL